MRLESVSDFDPPMIQSGRGVLLPLLPGVIERAGRVGARRIVSGTRCSPSRALAAVVCDCKNNLACPEMVGWFQSDFTTRDLYVVPTRSNKQEKTCPDLVLHGQIRPVKLEEENHTRAAKEGLQREPGLAAAEERRRWDRALMAKKKRANVRLDKNVLVTWENVTQEAADVKSGLESLVVGIEDSVSPTLKVAAGATPAYVR